MKNKHWTEKLQHKKKTFNEEKRKTTVIVKWKPSITCTCFHIWIVEVNKHPTFIWILHDKTFFFLFDEKNNNLVDEITFFYVDDSLIKLAQKIVPAQSVTLKILQSNLWCIVSRQCCEAKNIAEYRVSLNSWLLYINLRWK